MEDLELELYLPKKRTSDEPISSFTEVIGNVPTPWEKGDVITFPATIENNSFKTKIGNKKYEYIVVHVKSVDGSERQADFFPSLFRRRVRKYYREETNGVEKVIQTNDFLVAGGSIVTEIYDKSRKVNDVVTAVLGKSIRISEVNSVLSIEYGTTNLELAKVYDFEPEGWTIGNAPVYTTTDLDATKKIKKTYGNVVGNGWHNGHEWVDLGLSVKWATCNVGASSPEDYGDYFAWGETETKETYESYNSLIRGFSISDLESQGYIDSEGNLTPLHDAATANWGGNWKMPTKEEIEELEEECSWKWTTLNGIKGYKITGLNDNCIFLPAQGDPSYYYGNFWSSTRYNFSNFYAAYVLSYIFGDCYKAAFHEVGLHKCYYYSNVRPVLE